LANLPLQNRLVRFYVRMLLLFIPKPDVAFLLDADPEAASLRKPEYPLEFVRHNREAYLRLSRVVSMTVVPPLPVAQTADFIRKAVTQDSLDTEIDLRLQYPLAAGPAQSADGENVPTRC
jgi:hypothetical protein